MKVTETPLENVKIIELDYFSDNRGWFTESYNKDHFAAHGMKADFIQDNHSYSKSKGTLRGIHFQNNPRAQTKLVRCIRGRILDVAVDLRKGSPTYTQWIAVELSDVNRKQLYIPKGFGHGFVTLVDDVEIQYKVDQFYSKKHDRCIRFNDPTLNIDWGVENPILSIKDQEAPFLESSDVNFIVER